MAKCFSFVNIWESCLRFSFSRFGLKSVITDLGDGTLMHCWIPKKCRENKPNLLLIHGFGGNALWQWNGMISPFVSRFNVFVPDLVFFGKSRSTAAGRSEEFQARCVMAAMDAHGVKRMNVVGMSYGGFVAYSLAAQFGERLDKLVLCAAGVCLEEKDMEAGMFQVKSVEDAVAILVPRSPEKVREMLRIAFAKPRRPPPSCLLEDFMDATSRYYEEQKELIEALHKDRKWSNLPKINQATLIIWGEKDLIFPLELANRLKGLYMVRGGLKSQAHGTKSIIDSSICKSLCNSTGLWGRHPHYDWTHIGDQARLVVLKDAGHAINLERPKEMCLHIKSFLIDDQEGIPQKLHGNIERT